MAAVVAVGDRKAFLSDLLVEDLHKVAAWHGSRTNHEQRRFVQSVDDLHRSIARPAVGRDAPPRGEAACKPSIDDVRNSLMEWADGRSSSSGASAASPASSVCGGRRLSTASRTTTGSASVCSFPITTNQAHLRPHRRALLANRKVWKALDAHTDVQLPHGLPQDGALDIVRLQTMNQTTFGARPLCEQVNLGVFDGVVRDEQVGEVERCLRNASDQQRVRIVRAGRSLQSMRLEQDVRHRSVGQRAWDLRENSRLWRPAKARPVFRRSQRNASRVPLGVPPEAEIAKSRCIITEADRCTDALAPRASEPALPGAAAYVADSSGGWPAPPASSTAPPTPSSLASVSQRRLTAAQPPSCQKGQLRSRRPASAAASVAWRKCHGAEQPPRGGGALVAEVVVPPVGASSPSATPSTPATPARDRRALRPTSAPAYSVARCCPPEAVGVAHGHVKRAGAMAWIE
mmetsp:Transcript_12698/g.36529  ORF Transcript_12698/g.36529 Transcript_12698/m.36529 type:complete len:460 (-) Transcript_12698:52-1431(-)